MIPIAKTPIACLTVIASFLLGACATGVERGGSSGSTSPFDTVSVLGDRFFTQGLMRKRAHGAAPGHIHPFGEATANPVWEVAEWETQYELVEQDKVAGSDGWVRFANPGKALAFSKDGDHVAVKMDVFASAEYESPRQQNQAWPHLLIEQSFPQKPFLKDLTGLVLQFEGRLTGVAMRMDEAAYNPGLHSAQFQLFITVQDANPHSAHYGDYLWFGIPFYDYRHEQIPLYAAQDAGKGDATGKFIYSVASADIMEGSFHAGEWIRIEKDIYPLIADALKLANERGYLTGSAAEDFCLSGMNLGWEVPGTFDVGFEFRGFDLLAVTPNN